MQHAIHGSSKRRAEDDCDALICKYRYAVCHLRRTGDYWQEIAIPAPGCTEPCAGEGELLLGLTKHALLLAEPGGNVGIAVLRVFRPVLASGADAPSRA